MKKLVGTTILLLSILACGMPTQASSPTPSAIDTEVAATLTELTTVEPTNTEVPATQESGGLTPDGNSVDTENVSFLIPNGIANDATSITTTEVEYPYINPSNGDMPQHIKLTLNLYALSGTQFEPHIIIFHSSEYSKYSEMTAGIINTMQTSQYMDSQTLPENLGSEFTAQIHAVNFKNGHGVRYLTQVFTNFLPVNNKDLFYYYQGMTDDGQYYVQAILPINAPFLSADDNPNSPLPTDGILFNMDDFSSYLSATAQKLNTTDTFSFTPYLDHLDAMMESLVVTGF